MAAPNPLTTLRLPANVRRHLDVATAGAWQALAVAHADEILRLVRLAADDWSFDESLEYYFQEMGVAGDLAATVRNRALVRLESDERLDTSHPSMHLRDQTAPDGYAATDKSAWKRLRPDQLVRQLRQRQRRSTETGRIADLVLAQAEETIIVVHVENGLDFVGLLEQHMTPDRAVSYYVDAIGLSGCRAQAVVQRAMARIADAFFEPDAAAPGAQSASPARGDPPVS